MDEGRVNLQETTPIRIDMIQHRVRVRTFERHLDNLIYDIEVGTYVVFIFVFVHFTMVIAVLNLILLCQVCNYCKALFISYVMLFSLGLKYKPSFSVAYATLRYNNSYVL